jgi:hypothetical protein
MMKRLLPLLLLIGVVALAGCQVGGSRIGQGEPAGITCPGSGVTEGISITDWSFDFDQIYGAEAVGLTLTAENFGGKDGTLTSYTIFGPDIVYPGPGTNMQWVSDKAISSTSITSGALPAPNTDLGMPGGMWTDTYTMTAPTGLTVETPFTFNVRATYDYETSFSGILTVMSSTYLRSLPAEEREALIQSGGLSAQCFTGGPIKIEGAAGTHFVDPASTAKTVRFKVTNVGVGFPFYSATHNYNGITTDTMYKVHVQPISTGITCTDQTITLSRGQTGTFSCSFTAATPSYKTDYSFQVNIDYQYWQDQSASIKVLRPL